MIREEEDRSMTEAQFDYIIVGAGSAAGLESGYSKD
jgi:hypothetical protein